MATKLDKFEKLEMQRRIWEKMRGRGKQSYALLNGALGWGGLMFLLMSCVKIFVEHERLDLPYIVIGVLIWPLGGYCWGLWMWILCEKRLQGSTNKPPSIIRN